VVGLSGLQSVQQAVGEPVPAVEVVRNGEFADSRAGHHGVLVVTEYGVDPLDAAA
jgi:hypothetical protein